MRQRPLSKSTTPASITRSHPRHRTSCCFHSRARPPRSMGHLRWTAGTHARSARNLGAAHSIERLSWCQGGRRRRAGSVASATTAIAPVCGRAPLACADIGRPFGYGDNRASPSTQVRFCQRTSPNRVTIRSPCAPRRYSHFEVRCSETMRRRVPERPRSTTLSL